MEDVYRTSLVLDCLRILSMCLWVRLLHEYSNPGLHMAVFPGNPQIHWKKSNLRKYSSYFWFNAFSGFGEQNRLKNKTPDVYFHHSMAKSHIGVTIKLFNVFGGILWELHGWQARLFLFTTRAPWCCTVTAAFHSFWRSSANQQRRSSLGEDSCQYFHMSRAGGELHAVFYFPK